MYPIYIQKTVLAQKTFINIIFHTFLNPLNYGNVLIIDLNTTKNQHEHDKHLLQLSKILIKPYNSIKITLNYN